MTGVAGINTRSSCWPQQRAGSSDRTNSLSAAGGWPVRRPVGLLILPKWGAC